MRFYYLCSSFNILALLALIIRHVSSCSVAGNFDRRVSASLAFSNVNSHNLIGSLDCVNNENLSLPRERRRSIAAKNDEIVGGSRDGVLQQMIETSGYDCGNENDNCIVHLPQECTHEEDEQYCDAQQRYYSASSCPACNIMPDYPCPSDLSLITNACPLIVHGTYLGGDELIEGESSQFKNI